MVSWSDNAPVDVVVIAAGAIGPVGAEGVLELSAERDGELIEHVGRYRYCGIHDEQHLFTASDTGAPVYLHGHEIRSFR